jgi:hypothetical protein
MVTIGKYVFWAFSSLLITVGTVIGKKVIEEAEKKFKNREKEML